MIPTIWAKMKLNIKIVTNTVPISHVEKADRRRTKDLKINFHIHIRKCTLVFCSVFTLGVLSCISGPSCSFSGYPYRLFLEDIYIIYH